MIKLTKLSKLGKRENKLNFQLMKEDAKILI